MDGSVSFACNSSASVPFISAVSTSCSDIAVPSEISASKGSIGAGATEGKSTSMKGGIGTPIDSSSVGCFGCSISMLVNLQGTPCNNEVSSHGSSASERPSRNQGTQMTKMNGKRRYGTMAGWQVARENLWKIHGSVAVGSQQLMH